MTQSLQSWRGAQTVAQKERVKELASSLRTGLYFCLTCSWLCHYDGYGYDELMGVCGHCASRLHNLYERKHAGEWFNRERALDIDLAWHRDERAPPPRITAPTKAKISNRLRLEIYERDGFKCVYCGSRKRLSLDHVTAESNGGATDKGNLVTACRPCNSRKQTKTLADFWSQRQ